MPQRIPSPRELQYHTQSIMQNALIRKKLEEQRENYRKRQEQEKQENAKKSQQDQSPSTSSSDGTMISDQVVTTNAPSCQDEKSPMPESPMKKAPIAQSQLRQHAPSPSIFTLTPTSVLRKMTAEKESDASKNEKKKLLSGMTQSPHQQTSMRNPQQQQPPFMGNNNISQMDRLKMAQSDGNGMQFGGMNAWNTPPIQDMKPIGKK